MPADAMTACTVYGSVRSRTLRVLWALEELGRTYAVVHAAPRSEAVRALNPAGKIPVLTTGGVTLTDSVAIVQFLADRHGADPSGLTHPPARSPARSRTA